MARWLLGVFLVAAPAYAGLSLEARPTAGRLLIVAVGVNRYGAPLPALNAAVADAQKVTSALGLAGGGFRATSKWLLLDEAATVAQVRDAIDQAAQIAEEGDTFVFYFAGYGTHPPSTFRLLLSGATNLNAADPATSLSSEDLRVASNRVRARRQLFIFDTCYSVEGLKSFAQGVLAVSPDLARLVPERSVAVLGTAGLIMEGPTNGPIALALDEAVGGAADVGPKDGRISVAELEAYLRWRLHVLSGGGAQLVSLMRGRDFSLRGAPLKGRPLLGLVPDTTWMEAPATRGVVVGARGGDAPATGATATRQRRAVALVVGTNQYDNGAAWHRLDNPIPDARAIAALLDKRFGFEVELLENPTRAAFMNKVDELHDRITADDQLVIFIAGHGHFREGAFREGYLVFRDGTAQCGGNCLAHVELRQAVEHLPARQLLVVLDSCFGGTFGAQRGGTGAARPARISREEWIRRKLALRTRQYITSGGKEYVPDGTPGEHSPFAAALIDALTRGRDAVSFSDVVQRVGRVDPQPRYGSLPGSEPGADFVFLPR